MSFSSFAVSRRSLLVAVSAGLVGSLWTPRQVLAAQDEQQQRELEEAAADLSFVGRNVQGECDDLQRRRAALAGVLARKEGGRCRRPREQRGREPRVLAVGQTRALRRLVLRQARRVLLRAPCGLLRRR